MNTGKIMSNGSTSMKLPPTFNPRKDGTDTAVDYFCVVCDWAKVISGSILPDGSAVYSMSGAPEIVLRVPLDGLPSIDVNCSPLGKDKQKSL